MIENLGLFEDQWKQVEEQWLIIWSVSSYYDIIVQIVHTTFLEYAFKTPRKGILIATVCHMIY